jgi:hypothetical protein
MIRGAMTPEQRRGIADMLRRFTGLIADFAALSSILDVYEQRGEPPRDWRAFWTEMQGSEEYQASLKFFAPLLDAIEQATSDSALIALLYEVSKVPKSN